MAVPQEIAPLPTRFLPPDTCPLATVTCPLPFHQHTRMNLHFEYLFPPAVLPSAVDAMHAVVVVSLGSGTGVPPVNRHGQDGRATANDRTTHAVPAPCPLPPVPCLFIDIPALRAPYVLFSGVFTGRASGGRTLANALPRPAVITNLAYTGGMVWSTELVPMVRSISPMPGGFPPSLEVIPGPALPPPGY